MHKKIKSKLLHTIAPVVFAWLIGCTGITSFRSQSSSGSASSASPIVGSITQVVPTLTPTPSVSPTQASAQPTQAVQPNTTEPPALIGTRLHSNENETATQRAIELTRKLNEAEADRKQLTAQVEELRASGKAKDQALDQARMEIQTARTQMARAREELEQWKQEIASLRDKVRGADEENLQTLQTAVALLQQILSQSVEQDKRSAAAAAQTSSE